MNYTATAERVGRFWEITVSDLDNRVTESTRLDQAEHMARDLIATWRDVDPATVEVTVTPNIDPAINGMLAEAHRLRSQAAAWNMEAAHQITEAAQSLRDAGLSVRDIGSVLGVSYQRAQQIINA